MSDEPRRTMTTSNPYAPPTANVDGVETSPAQDGQLPYLLPCSTLKLLVLSATTLNIYLIYWFWKNFRHEQRRNPEISAVLRTIFSGIFYYTLARSALDEADSRGLPARYSPMLLTGLLWVGGTASNFLPDPWSLLVFLIALFLVPVQRAVNRINRHIDPALGAAEGFSGWEIALAVPGSLLLLLAIAGMLLFPEAASEP